MFSASFRGNGVFPLSLVSSYQPLRFPGQQHLHVIADSRRGTDCGHGIAHPPTGQKSQPICRPHVPLGLRRPHHHDLATNRTPYQQLSQLSL
ncbi:hypothetical protein VTI74DRAFT_6784 [Chaetomium olivicolor]